MTPLSLVFFVLTVVCQLRNAAKIATFTTDLTGIAGQVIIEDGIVKVDLDLSNINKNELPFDGCLDNGLQYHIHTKWDHSEVNEAIGAKNCGSDYTGPHWDPYNACSTKTQSSFCECRTQYLCNPKTYNYDPYFCEVGDLSGKYGTLQLDKNNNIYKVVSSFWEADSSDLIDGQSIVFHCNTEAAERAFCSTFIDSKDNNNNNNSNSMQIKSLNKESHSDSDSDSHSESNSNSDFDVVIAQTTNVKSLKVQFGKKRHKNYMIFEKNGKVKVSLDASKFKSELYQSGCTKFKFGIFDNWDITSLYNKNNNYYHSSDSDSDSSDNYEDAIYFFNKKCENVVGLIYDPTASCYHKLSNNDRCFNDKLCDKQEYKYQCNWNEERFSCAPGDLSGKYGVYDIYEYDYKYKKDITDYTIPKLTNIIGKSVGIYCADHNNDKNQNLKFFACGKLVADEDDSSSD